MKHFFYFYIYLFYPLKSPKIVAFDFLNEPSNGIHRAGAIGVGAVAGYILAIRRGFFRRLLYTSAGGLGVASICYPNEAEHYWHETILQSKVYATILYNFAYGGKKEFCQNHRKSLENLIFFILKLISTIFFEFIFQ